MSGIICRSVGVLPFYDLVASCIGTGLLAGMAYLWHDRALLMVNGGSMCFFSFYGYPEFIYLVKF